MGRRKPPKPNPRWKKGSDVWCIYQVLIARYPKRTPMPDLAKYAIGGLGRRMDEIRKYLKSIGWDYDNDCRWNTGARRWYSEYWMIYTGIVITK